MNIRDFFRKIRRLVPFPLRVEYFRLKRKIRQSLKSEDFTGLKTADNGKFPFEVFHHRSRLVRDYPEPWYTLQYNKINNLNLIIPKITGTVLPPEKIFSFWKLAGRTSARKGFKKGMTLIDGEVTSSMGGGLCQLSNALYWSALNLGFEITERHRHSFDIFPDTNRTIPFGSGATVFYNYVDLAFKNNSEISYLFDVYLDEEFLNIKVFADREMETVYRIEEENHSFCEVEDKIYRQNELFRLHLDREGKVVDKEFICKNNGLVLYEIPDSQN